jgi:hypothetical protein
VAERGVRSAEEISGTPGFFTYWSWAEFGKEYDKPYARGIIKIVRGGAAAVVIVVAMAATGGTAAIVIVPSGIAGSQVIDNVATGIEEIATNTPLDTRTYNMLRTWGYTDKDARAMEDLALGLAGGGGPAPSPSSPPLPRTGQILDAGRGVKVVVLTEDAVRANPAVVPLEVLAMISGGGAGGGGGGGGGGSPGQGGQELDPTTTPVYRGGRDLTVKPNELRVDKATGLVQPTHGISLNTDPGKLAQFGGAFRVKSIPSELKIIQRGTKPGHYEIVPREPMPMQRFQELLQKVVLE